MSFGLELFGLREEAHGLAQAAGLMEASARVVRLPIL
jgi:hypothetical protein